MEYRAVTRYLRISPRKLRLVADLVRGKDVDEAMDILRLVPKKGAQMILKTLNSAVANAQEQDADIDRLYIKRIFVDRGPMYKRWRAAAYGRPVMRRKRTSHLTIILEEKER